MENTTEITCQLLQCGYLDLEFLDRLIGAYSLDIWINDIDFYYGKVDNINILIYEAYRQIKDMFLEEKEGEIKALGFNPEDFEEGEDFEISTNYMDSHLWFNDCGIEEIFEKWRKH